jgi:hypothetical protein
MTKPVRASEHCRHYSYKRTGDLETSGPHCACGVDLSAPGAGRKCWPEPKEFCDQRQEYTPEEHAAWRTWMDESNMRMVKAFAALVENVGIIKPRTEGKIACPNCGKDLHYSRGKNRVWIVCKTVDCVHIEVEPDPRKPWPGVDRMEPKGNA